jgi:putative ABC transport system ATP-binding protein
MKIGGDQDSHQQARSLARDERFDYMKGLERGNRKWNAERTGVSIVLDVKNLTKRFQDGERCVDALRGVSLQVRAGEFVAIMGASGSGKSTLLHLSGGLDQPTAGTVQVDGRDLDAMSDAARTIFRRRRLGIIFQAYNLLPTLNARQNVALPLLVDGESVKDIESRTNELLKMVHLEARANHLPGAMSGGEQQRVAIARALMNDPALILADEPTGNLDSHNADEIWRLLARLAHEMGKAVLMVTHETAGAHAADRVVVLKDGLIVGEIHHASRLDESELARRYVELAGHPAAPAESNP